MRPPASLGWPRAPLLTGQLGSSEEIPVNSPYILLLLFVVKGALLGLLKDCWSCGGRGVTDPMGLAVPSLWLGLLAAPGCRVHSPASLAWAAGPQFRPAGGERRPAGDKNSPCSREEVCVSGANLSPLFSCLIAGRQLSPTATGTRHQSEIKMGFLEVAAAPGSVTQRESLCGLLSHHLTPGLSTGVNSTGLFSHPPVPCLCSLWSPSWHLLLWGPAVLATQPLALPQTFLLPFSCTPLLPPAVLHSVPCSQVLHATHQTPPLAPATLGPSPHGCGCSGQQLISSHTLGARQREPQEG